MTTVVTGGAGFIGSALARRLAERRRAGDRIVLADDLSHGSPRSPVQPLLSRGSVELIRGDLCSTTTFANLPDAVDRVYHLAGIVGVGRVMAHPFDTLERNLRMTLNTIQWFRRAALPEARFAFASSSEVIGSAAPTASAVAVPTSESAGIVPTQPYSPRQSYQVAKLVGEMLLAYCEPSAGAAMFSIRYHNVYGPDMGREHAIPQIVERIRRRQVPFELYGADETRSFCWIDDAVFSTAALMEARGVQPGMVVNVGNPRGEVAIRKVYDRLFDVCGWRPDRIVYRSAGTEAVGRRCPDTRLLESLVGSVDHLPLEEGLRRTAAWYLQRPA